MFYFPTMLEKVTAFILRHTPDGRTQIAVLRHPHAGLQIPAGTLEPGETPEQAVRREAAEETGLSTFDTVAQVGVEDTRLADPARVVLTDTAVYTRPDVTSGVRAQLKRGLWLQITGRHTAGWAQIYWEETDRYPDPQYVTASVMGWVPDRVVCADVRRYYFRLAFTGQAPARWHTFSDDHRFEIFWATLSADLDIIDSQQPWLRFLPQPDR